MFVLMFIYPADLEEFVIFSSFVVAWGNLFSACLVNETQCFLV